MHYKSSKFNAFTVYMFISGMTAFATNTIFTINILYQIKTVHLNALQLVLVGTTLETACFICQVPTGVLADTYSRRLSVIIGYSLMGIGFLLEGLVPTFLAMLLAQVLWGCGSTFVTGAEEAWCADEMGDEQAGRAFMRGSQVGQIASLLSIPLSIWLATYRLNLSVVAGSILLLILALCLFLFMPEQHFQPATNEERNSWKTMARTIIDGSKAVKKSRMLLIILGITAFAAMSSEGFDRLQTDHFASDFTFPAFGDAQHLIWFGVISAGATLLTLIATEIIRRRVNINNQTATIRIMFACNVLLVASIAAFALAGNFYLALLAFWCASIFRRADAPLYTTWITRNSHPRMRATILSMFGQVDAIGQIVGGPAVGYIGTVVSLRAALLATSAILSPCIPFFIGALLLKKQAWTDNEPAQEVQTTPAIELAE